MVDPSDVDEVPTVTSTPPAWSQWRPSKVAIVWVVVLLLTFMTEFAISFMAPVQTGQRPSPRPLRKLPAMSSIQLATWETRVILASGNPTQILPGLQDPATLWFTLAKDTESLHYARLSLVAEGVGHKTLSRLNRALFLVACTAKPSSNVTTASTGNCTDELALWDYVYGTAKKPISGSVSTRIVSMNLGVYEGFVLSDLASKVGDKIRAGELLAAAGRRAAWSIVPIILSIGVIFMGGVVGFGVYLWEATICFGRWIWVRWAIPSLFLLTLILAAASAQTFFSGAILAIFIVWIMLSPLVILPSIVMIIAASRGESLFAKWFRVSLTNQPVEPARAVRLWDDGITGFLAYMGSYRCAQLAVQFLALILPLDFVFLLGCAQLFSAVGVLYWIAKRRIARGDSMDSFGFRFRPSNLSEGFFAYATVVPLVMVVSVVAGLLRPASSLSDSNPMFQLIEGNTGGLHLALLFMMAAVFAPIFEEVFFRGILLSAFRVRFPGFVPIVVVSVLFGMLHPPSDWASVATLGMGFAIWRLRTGSLVPAIIAHALQNGTATVAASYLLSLN